MQTTHKIEGSSAVRFARYLLAEASRGDYYTRDGQDDSAPTQWHGPEKLLRSFGIDPEKPVELKHLGPLMQGFHPVTGKPIRPAGSNGTRTAGIDLTYSPPKEVSALWATGSSYRRAQIEVAHHKAVKSTLERIEREVALVRRKTNGVQRFEKAKGLLATEVVHTTSRLGKDQDEHGIPDPQLHSHIMLIAAERKDGVLAAIESKQLYQSAREHGAWYRSELAANLQELGVGIERHQGNGERYFAVRGVSKGLSERWSTRTQDVHRAANLFRTRYGREPGPGELDSITLSTRGSKTAAPPEEVNAAWRALGEEHNQTARRSEEAFHDWGLHRDPNIDLGKELLENVTREASMITTHELRAKAYELSAGVCRPADADRLVNELARSGELLQLEGGLWTTRQLRELEQSTVGIAERRVTENAAPVSEEALKQARREIGRDIKGSLSREQREALDTITGTGGVTVLVGRAGTGKGVVISTAARSWQLEGNEVIGTAIAGNRAQGLKEEAKLDRAHTTDGLIKGVQKGRIKLSPNTVVVMDEAGMADTTRLAKLAQLTARENAKLVLVGDAAQLSSIGPGGLFAQLDGKVPTAELTEVHRANHEWERQAWEQIRAGEPGPALAQYQSHDRLHITDTRAEAVDAMVDHWELMRKGLPRNQAVMITDASNLERDQMNAMAQERRAQAGELGAHQVELPGKPYGLRAGDEIIFSAQFRIPGQQRIENGITGTILETSRDEDKVTIRTNEREPREVEVDPTEFSDLSLSYAVHVHKAQGITAETSGILIGGWQTDKEHAYVAVSRAREQTQIYVSREDLGEMGLDTGAMERLAEKIKHSRAQEATITKNLAEREVPEPPDLVSQREPRRKRPNDRTVDDDVLPRERIDEPTSDCVERDANERFKQYQQQPDKVVVNIRDADPADIRLDAHDLGETRVAYSTQLYDLNGVTNEPTYALFGAWERGEQLGFTITTHNDRGHTHIHIETEQREGRNAETALTDRIEDAIQRSQSHEASNAREHSPTQLETGHPTPPQQPALEPVRQDAYIEQAIQGERDRQQAFEQGTDQDRDNDLGFGIE